ncbi:MULTISPECIES: fimbrial protein [unclassified Serratia (in: enterobacteria)]|uniref:fimbrial protein n=1 Tax=unclassified Serratia (in: enterobacteria) TaxID=2647522 RepID=UPI000907BF4F|nr:MULTISPECIES: fimbrial protein [unclassified Serratia (in: enterobacteria)]
MKNTVKIIGLLLALLTSINAYADIQCGLDYRYPYRELTVPLSGSVYAGNELPVGATLYKFRVTGSDNKVALRCETTESWIANVYYKVVSEPIGPAFNFAGNTYNGAVYPTNINGIGIAIYTYNVNANPTITMATPMYEPMNYQSDGSSIGTSSGLKINPAIYIALVKTGAIASGSSVLGSTIPPLSITAELTPGLSGLPLDLLKINFSGSVIVRTSTCQTKSRTVILGEHELRSTFKGKGSVTPWIDSSIELTDCPTFEGYYPGGYQTSFDGATPTGGTPTPNALLVSITANTGVIDAAAGLISINKTQSGSASGLGIQLGWGDKSKPSVWNLSEQKKFTLPNNGVKNITIPMAARYYQTENVVTPGRADGQVMFTINYN